MKVDPTHKPLQINTPRKAQLTGDTGAKPDFAHVLDASMQKKDVHAVDKNKIIPSAARPDLRTQIDIQSPEWQAADGMLDALDAYRNQLSNPEATLKMVEPYVGRMKELQKSHQLLLDQLPEGSPVKQVLQQTMVHVSKEIERFHMGYYID